jgi:hypothetical protein
VANIRALATIAILVTAGSGASIAMPPQDIPGEVKSCQAITDDKARLRCFDSLLVDLPSSRTLRKDRKRAGQSMRPNRLMEALKWSPRIS